MFTVLMFYEKDENFYYTLRDSITHFGKLLVLFEYLSAGYVDDTFITLNRNKMLANHFITIQKIGNVFLL